MFRKFHWIVLFNLVKFWNTFLKVHSLNLWIWILLVLAILIIIFNQYYNGIWKVNLIYQCGSFVVIHIFVVFVTLQFVLVYKHFLYADFTANKQKTNLIVLFLKNTKKKRKSIDQSIDKFGQQMKLDSTNQVIFII